LISSQIEASKPLFTIPIKKIAELRYEELKHCSSVLHTEKPDLLEKEIAGV